jgi:hypothetical protein
VLANELDPRDLAKARDEYKRRPLDGPRYVAAVQPADPREVQRILFSALEGGKDLPAYPQYYLPYNDQASAALKRSKPVDPMLAKEGRAVERYLQSAGRSPSSVRFLALRGKALDGLVLVDAISGMPVQVMLVDPW